MKTEDLGDGVAVTADLHDGCWECVFSIHGDQVAVAYVDDHGAARVDFTERLHLGLNEFRRTLIVHVLAWSRAEQMSVLWRQMPPRNLSDIFKEFSTGHTVSKL